MVLGFIFGFLNWFWAFMIVGSAYYDWVANKPIENPNFGVYILLLIVNMVFSIAIMALYLWKYEKNHPIIEDKWILDAVVLGLIICIMNYLLDIIFFGFILQIDLFTYFFLESTAGYSYPIIILIALVLAYLIYGKNE